jgi:putative membrane protein
MVFGWIWMVVVIGAIIALVVWGIRRLSEHGGSGAGPAARRDPLDIAKERYARGEITKEQFDQIRRDLS